MHGSDQPALLARSCSGTRSNALWMLHGMLLTASAVEADGLFYSRGDPFKVRVKHAQDARNGASDFTLGYHDFCCSGANSWSPLSAAFSWSCSQRAASTTLSG
jgi:hypothetical protein